MRHQFHSEQWLPYPIARVFSFFGDPRNLPRLMPSWQAARIDSSSIVQPPDLPEQAFTSIAAGAGTRMTISFRPFPLAPFRVKWDAEIVEFSWNDHFCDVQHRGPFAYWRHCHRMTVEHRDGRSGTLLRDDLTYELPFGVFGEVANHLIMPMQLRSIFKYRQRRTSELLPLA